MVKVNIIPLSKKHLKYFASKEKVGISNFLMTLISSYSEKYKKYDIQKSHARYIPRKGYVFSKPGRGAFKIFYVSSTKYNEKQSSLSDYRINTKTGIVAEDITKKIKDSLDPDKIMIPKVNRSSDITVKVKIR